MINATYDLQNCWIWRQCEWLCAVSSSHLNSPEQNHISFSYTSLACLMSVTFNLSVPPFISLYVVPGIAVRRRDLIHTELWLMLQHILFSLTSSSRHLSQLQGEAPGWILYGLLSDSVKNSVTVLPRQQNPCVDHWIFNNKTVTCRNLNNTRRPDKSRKI